MLTFRSSWGSLHILRRLVPSWRPCHGFSSSPSPPGQGSWRRTSWTYKPGWCPANWGCPRTSLLLLGSLLRQKSATDGSWDRWVNTRKRKGACNVSSRSSSRILSPQNQGSYFSWFQKTHRWKKHPGRIKLMFWSPTRYISYPPQMICESWDFRNRNWTRRIPHSDVKQDFQGFLFYF